MRYTSYFLIHMITLTGAVNIYPHLNDPAEHPDYDRYSVKHPTYSTFGDKPKFEALRSFQLQNLHIVNYKEDIDKFLLLDNTSLGSVIWPSYPFLYADNVKEVIDYIASKNLFVAGVWGFVPGSGPGNGREYQENFPQEYHPPQDVLMYMEQKLGEKWFGVSAGEQDGRYIGSYVFEMMPTNGDRVKQYLNFRMHFKGMEDILGPKMFVLHGLPMPHYVLKTGLYTIAGAETAQGLPNAQIFYSFIRGAGKQYGVLWMGNVSVYNRFGYKVYTNSTNKQTVEHHHNHYSETVEEITKYGMNRHVNFTCMTQNDGGPTCGTSLNLMKRLMYSHIMYNSAYMGFENEWFIGGSDNFSPIGQMQHAAKQWLQDFGSVGTHLANVGLLLDFYSGWNPPRHFYGGTLYRVWSNLPYSDGDYFTDNIFQMFYPRYQDCSYFHDESGFSSATPYGDMLDVILTDAALWDMQRYDTLIFASTLQYTRELSDNLEKYIRSGGNVIITADNFALFQDDFYPFLKAKVDLNSCDYVPPGQIVSVNLTNYYFNITEVNPMTVCKFHYYGSNAQILAETADYFRQLTFLFHPFDGSGYVMVFATPYAMSAKLVNVPTNDVGVPMLPAFPLLLHAYIMIDRFLTNTSIFYLLQPSVNLSYIVNYVSDRDYLILVTNPLIKEQPFKIVSPLGKIVKIVEHPLDQSEKNKTGYLPDGYEGTDLGVSTDTTIAGVDTRLFTVTLDSDVVKIIDKVTPKPRPNGVVLHLRQISNSLMDEIHRRPTFFRHFDSVIVDYSYVMSKDNDFLVTEAKWASEQNLKVYVDASPAIDLFPNLRLVNNSVTDFNMSFASLQQLLQKLAVYQVRNLIISLHRVPENDITYSATLQEFNTTLHTLLQLADAKGIKMHLRDATKNPSGNIGGTYLWLKNCNLDSSIKIAPNLALIWQQPLSDISYVLKDAPLFFLNTPQNDLYGNRYTVNNPIHDQGDNVTKPLTELCSIRTCPYRKGTNTIPLVIDANLPTPEDEYLEADWLETFLINKQP
ncbi:uncharacterized protein [Dysidea avara]